jgi:cyclophilin family peptidyl-prolyl cis-trans isomerase
MARRERERYTERARPHRQEPGQSSSGSSGGGAKNGEGSPMKNPVVLVAVGALALAGVLAIGVMLGQRPAAPATATQPAAGTASVEVPTDSAAASAAAPTTDAALAATPAADSSGLSLPGSGTPYSAPTDQQLDATKAYFATITTPKGDIVVEMWPDIAPKHVNSLVFLAREGFYDGLTFHRVDAGFVIQGGDPNGDGTGGPGYSVPAEFNASNPVPHRKGTLAMARSQDPNSAGSQFYIVLEDGPSATSLDGEYTNFGHVVEGMSVVEQIAIGDVMTKVTIEEKPIAESMVSPDDIRQGNLPKND